VLIGIALFGGVASAFDIPTRQALMVEFVGRDDVVDAIALNSSGFNLARIAGPSLAAIIIDRFGLAWCFAANACSYLLVLISLFTIRLPAKVIAATDLSPTEGLIEGIRFMRKSREVSLLMSMVTVCSIFGIPYLVLMPVIARDTLHGNRLRYHNTSLSAGGQMHVEPLPGYAPDLTFEQKDGKLWIKDAKGDTAMVTIRNVMQSNGVIHVIDTVLLPG